MKKKSNVITEIFKICSKKGDFVFDNKLVKSVSLKYDFKNPFDATKFDNTLKLPEILNDEDYFILHLGRGKHKFVKGISNGYHRFELIEEDEIFDWKYRKSILNELDTSESNILSIASNQKIIHDFLYDDIVSSPKIYNSRRTKISFNYLAGEEIIETNSLQMEIDLTMELNGIVSIFEGKNGFPDDFAIYQLFHPFSYYIKLKEENKLNLKKITCCYIIRKKDKKKNSVIRIYNYIFKDENKINSIKCIKKAQYNLIIR